MQQFGRADWQWRAGMVEHVIGGSAASDVAAAQPLTVVNGGQPEQPRQCRMFGTIAVTRFARSDRCQPQVQAMPGARIAT